jgi:cysteine desulfurase
VAAELAAARIDHANSVSKLRDRFESEVLQAIEGSEVNGDRDRRLPNTTNLYFPDVDGEGLLILLDEAGICCSPGSACSTGSVKPSRILKAMGQSSSRARGSVRFSLSHLTTEDEVVKAVSAIETAVGKLRVVLPSGGSRVIRGSSGE